MSKGHLLPRSHPSDHDVSSDQLARFFEDVRDRRLGLHSFILVRHGHVVSEHWWKPYGPDKPHMLYSLSKSFTSTAIGLAAHEKLLHIDDDVLPYFKPWVTPEIQENMKDLKIRHLLSMSTGHVEDTMPFLHNDPDGDWIRAFLQVPIQRPPGTHFLYNTGASYMLSAIVQRVTGERVLSFLTPRLFEPLGIPNPTWEMCPNGIDTGGFGLSIRTEDIAAFGELYLRKGVWHGQQLIPSAWVDDATRKHIDNGDAPESDWAQGYGFQFWRCRHGAYRGDGAFGQFCVVIPDEDAVVAITSGVADMQAVLDAVWANVLPALQGDSGSDTARQVIPDEAVAGPEGLEPTNHREPNWADRWYALEENPWGWTRMKLQFDGDNFTLLGESGDGEWSLVGGYGTWSPDQDITWSTSSRYRRVSLQGGWRNDAFVVALCMVETPYMFTLECSPSNHDLNVRAESNVGFGGAQVFSTTGHAE